MKSVLLSKKGQLQSIVISLVIIGIVLGVGFLVMEEFMDEMTAGSEAESGVNDTIVALAEVPTWLSIIVIIAVVGVILAMVFVLMPREGIAVGTES